MVTLPDTAAENNTFVNYLIQSGMNSARINCAHEGPVEWGKMIANVERSKKSLRKNAGNLQLSHKQFNI